MKSFILIIALLFVVILPQNILAQQSATSNLSDNYVSDIPQRMDANKPIYKISKFGTIGGASVAAVGGILYLIGRNKTTTDVMSIEGSLGIAGMIVGGMSLVASLPFYLWGLHLEQQPNGSALIVGTNPRGWGGVVDFGYGVENTFGIGGSFGYNVGHQIFVGLGAGCEYYPNRECGEYEEPYTFPAYVDFRARLGKNRIVPYLGVKVGVELASVPVPYGAVEWGVSHQPKESRGSWLYAIGLSTTHHTLSVKIARSF